MQDQHAHANGSANGDALPKFTVNHGTGFTGFGAVGWGFGNGLRVESEGLYNFSHDNYTDYDKQTHYEDQTHYEEQTKYESYNQYMGSKAFYKPYPGAKQVPCTGPGGLFAPGYSPADIWGTGPGSASTETTTPSDKWYYIPADA